jgi:hypothetical protein
MALNLAPSRFGKKRLSAIPGLDRAIALAAVAIPTGGDNVVDLIQSAMN